MPAPLSLDLRKRIFAHREKTGATFEETAAHFDVGEATVNRLFALHRSTGSLEPKPRVGGPPPTIGDDDLALLRIIVEANNDATLKDLCDRWHDRKGIRISASTMFRVVKRAGLTLKKSRSERQSDSGRTSSRGGRPTRKSSKGLSSIGSSSSTSAE
jgi:transposase